MPKHIAIQFDLPLATQTDLTIKTAAVSADLVSQAALPQERGHHPFGMSVLNSVAACSGYRSRHTTSEAAEDGTRLHGVTEKVIKRVLSRGLLHMDHAAATMLREVLETEPVSEEEEVYLEFCCKELDQWLPKVQGEVLIEQRVHIYNPDGAELNYGHYDLLLFLTDEVAILFDWKFGWIPVPPAQSNWQGKGYAVACLQKYPKLKKVGVIFVQPKLHKVTRTSYDRENLFTMWQEVHGIIARAQLPEKALHPNPYCDFCAQAATCTALLNEANRALALYEGLPVPAGFTGLQITSAEDAARAMFVLDRLKVLIDRADELKDRAKQFARDNGGMLAAPLPDGRLITVELRSKRAARSAEHPGMIAEVLKDYLSTEQVLGACDLKITLLEEIFADAFVARQAAEAQAVIDQAEAAARQNEHSGDLTGAAQVREAAKREAKAIRVTKKKAVEILNSTLQAEGLLSRPESKVEYLKVRIEKPVNQITK